MLFNSYEFIFLFLPFTFFTYYFFLNKGLFTGAKSFLVLASLFFYSWWDISYLPLILLSLLFNFMVGKSLIDEQNKIKRLKIVKLAFGTIVNLLLLGYFKYADFFIENFNIAFDGTTPLLHLTLPLAISFFTFQQIAYLVDSYKGETGDYNFLDYMLFVTFFPQLIAGPIVHHSEMMPQFSRHQNQVKNYQNIAVGIFIFSIGLFKKVVIADSFAYWANIGFDQSEVLNFLEAWVTSLSYTFQLYFDFSGYADMAIGGALLFNIKLPINFHSPYKAKNIQDFWRRWHITLSRFLRDYVYIPLGGSKRGTCRTYNNLMITFILGGLWHGAGWTFIFWGAIHGVALVVHRFWTKVGFSMNAFLAWFITFNFVNISWVFFRAKEWDDAIKVIDGMMSLKTVMIPSDLKSTLESCCNISFVQKVGTASLLFTAETLVYLLLSAIVILVMPNSIQLVNKMMFKSIAVKAIFASILFVVAVYNISKYSEFIYFNF